VKLWLEWVLDSHLFNAFVLLTSVYALFADDVRLAVCSKSSDPAFFGVASGVMLLWFCELVGGAILQPNTIGGFYFWLETTACLSMATDIGWIWQPLVLSITSPSGADPSSSTWCLSGQEWQDAATLGYTLSFGASTPCLVSHDASSKLLVGLRVVRLLRFARVLKFFKALKKSITWLYLRSWSRDAALDAAVQPALVDQQQVEGAEAMRSPQNSALLLRRTSMAELTTSLGPATASPEQRLAWAAQSCSGPFALGGIGGFAGSTLALQEACDPLAGLAGAGSSLVLTTVGRRQSFRLYSGASTRSGPLRSSGSFWTASGGSAPSRRSGTGPQPRVRRMSSFGAGLVRAQTSLMQAAPPGADGSGVRRRKGSLALALHAGVGVVEGQRAAPSPSSRDYHANSLGIQKIGSKLSDLTTKRIVILVFACLFISAFLNRSFTQHFEGAAVYQQLGLYQLHTASQAANTAAWPELKLAVQTYGLNAGQLRLLRLPSCGVSSPNDTTVDGWLFEMHTLVAGGSASDETSEEPVVAVLQNGETQPSLPSNTSGAWLLDTRAPGMQPLALFPNRAAALTQLRGPEYRYFVSSGCVSSNGSCSSCSSYALFDARAASVQEAMFSIGATVFLLLLVGFASLVFTRDAQALVVRHIERMVRMMKALRKNPLQPLDKLYQQLKEQDREGAAGERARDGVLSCGCNACHRNCGRCGLACALCISPFSWSLLLCRRACPLRTPRKPVSEGMAGQADLAVPPSTTSSAGFSASQSPPAPHTPAILRASTSGKSPRDSIVVTKARSAASGSGNFVLPAVEMPASRCGGRLVRCCGSALAAVGSRVGDALASFRARCWTFLFAIHDDETDSYETLLLESALVSVGGLLQVSFGEAGREILQKNIAAGGLLRPMVRGTQVDAVFGFCDVRNFVSLANDCFGSPT
jgi:hypothetical protein